MLGRLDGHTLTTIQLALYFVRPSRSTQIAPVDVHGLSIREPAMAGMAGMGSCGGHVQQFTRGTSLLGLS